MNLRKGLILNRLMPILIWVLAISCIVMLYMYRSNSFSIRGLAYSKSYVVSTVSSARLVKLPVELYQHVKEGDVLAYIEFGDEIANEYKKAEIESDKRVAKIELEKLKAELVATQEQLSLDRDKLASDNVKLNRDAVLDVEKARLTLLEIKFDLEPSKVLLEGLAVERDILKQLVEKNAVELYELQQGELLYNEMAKRVEVLGEQFAEAEANLNEAQVRIDSLGILDIADEAMQALIAPISKSIEAQMQSIDDMYVVDTTKAVRAPFDGVVTQVFYGEGQAVTAGLPILTLNGESAESVVVWLNAGQINNIVENQKVEIIRPLANQKRIQGTVVGISRKFEEIPLALLRNPDMPQWGRPVKVSIPAGVDIADNEIVGVRGVLAR